MPIAQIAIHCKMLSWMSYILPMIKIGDWWAVPIAMGLITLLVSVSFRSTIPFKIMYDDVIKWKYIRLTGPWWGEFTDHRWISLKQASNAELGFFYLRLNKGLSNCRYAVDWRRHRAHCGVTVMSCIDIECTYFCFCTVINVFSNNYTRTDLMSFP